jgi:exosortase sorting signal-containing protein
MVRLLLGLLAVSSVLTFGTTVSSAATFSWTVSCSEVVVGPVTVLAINFAGSVDVTEGVPVTVALLPTANLVRNDNPSAPAGTHTGTLSCSLTFGGVTVPFTRSLTLTIDSNGNGDMTVGPVSILVNLGPSLGAVNLSAPVFTSVGYVSNIPLIATPLAVNTTVLLSPAAIPTLSTWAMMALVAVMLGTGFLFLRRRAWLA